MRGAVDACTAKQQKIRFDIRCLFAMQRRIGPSQSCTDTRRNGKHFSYRWQFFWLLQAKNELKYYRSYASPRRFRSLLHIDARENDQHFNYRCQSFEPLQAPKDGLVPLHRLQSGPVYGHESHTSLARLTNFTSLTSLTGLTGLKRQTALDIDTIKAHACEHEQRHV